VATLLTTVGLDHEHILGATRVQIAAEELGLLKKGTPLFTGVDEDLRGQVFTAAVTAGSPCFFLDELARWSDDGRDQGQTWDLTLRQRLLAGLPDPGTPAMRRNVALALLALSELEYARSETLLPDDPALSLRNLFLPGRYQPVLANPNWIFDTAHNVQALTQALGEFLRAPCSGRRVVLFGAMQDKALNGELATLFGRCDHLVGLPVSLPRSRTADDMQMLLRELGQTPGDLASLWRERCTVAPDMASGMRAVAAGLRPDDCVLVTGSCFTVAEVLHRLGVADLQQTRDVREAGPVLEQLLATTTDETK